MPAQSRPRARSSVDHLFDLVESLEEDQLQSFLAELNSTPDTNIDVSSGVAYFEEQRRQQALKKKQLRPTPSFLNAPPEPADWPRQKPRPVSGSQWRQSMRIVSTPYAKHGNEPVSPPLTASPPASPSLPPALGRRSVTAPVGKIEVRVDTRRAEEPSPVSPPRHQLEGDDADYTRSLAFDAFSFGLDGAQQQQQHFDDTDAQLVHEVYNSSEEEQSRPVSPAQLAITPPPELQHPAFSRMETMPALHHTPLSFDTASVQRPRTSMGLSPRAFRRVSRPVFLAPAEGADELAGRLSAYLFGGGAAPVAPKQSFVGQRVEERSELEEMFKEPGTSMGRALFGKSDAEGVPVSGIFEVLTEGSSSRA